MTNQWKDEHMTIVEFLLARIAEDESLTRSLWMSYCDGPEGIRDGVVVMDDYFGAAELVVGYSRMLAECAAKRAIVRDAEEWAELGDRAETTGMQALAQFTRDLNALRHLATIYADHPDYRQEWKP